MRAYDNVNHPERYGRGSVECIDAQESAMVGKPQDEAHCVAEVMGYIWRYDMKEPVRSLESAKWYLERLIEKVKARTYADKRQQWLPGMEPKDKGEDDMIRIKTTACDGDASENIEECYATWHEFINGRTDHDANALRLRRLLDPRVRRTQTVVRPKTVPTDVLLRVREDLLRIREALLRDLGDLALENVDVLIDNIDNKLAEV